MHLWFWHPLPVTQKLTLIESDKHHNCLLKLLHQQLEFWFQPFFNWLFRVYRIDCEFVSSHKSHFCWPIKQIPNANKLSNVAEWKQCSSSIYGLKAYLKMNLMQRKIWKCIALKRSNNEFDKSDSTLNKLTFPHTDQYHELKWNFFGYLYRYLCTQLLNIIRLKGLLSENICLPVQFQSTKKPIFLSCRKWAVNSVRFFPFQVIYWFNILLFPR